MIKSKQPEFKVEEVLKKGIQLFTIEKVVDEPTLTINDYASGTTLVITRTEARRDYDLFSRKAKTGHPFRQKTVKIETAPPESTANRPTITGEFPPSPTPEAVPPTPAHTDEAPKNEPVPFDPATFTIKVRTGTYKHLMTASGKPFYGNELRPTLIRLLKDFGITGSPAELQAKLMRNYPDSQGLREMLSILKGGTARKE